MPGKVKDVKDGRMMTYYPILSNLRQCRIPNWQSLVCNKEISVPTIKYTTINPFVIQIYVNNKFYQIINISGFHGEKGPLKISVKHSEVSNITIQAVKELGFSETDCNGADQLGYFTNRVILVII